MEPKTIIVINDDSAEAEHAAMLALKIARREKAFIVLANETTVDMQELNAANEVNLTPAVGFKKRSGSYLLNKLSQFSGLNSTEPVGITEIDISTFRVDDLSRFIIKNNIWMIVKGSADIGAQNTHDLHLHIQYVLNRVMCPLLIVPHCFKAKDFERIVYVADLRYCRLPVVRYLADFARPYRAAIFIDHVSAKGLPDMHEAYANSFFEHEIAAKTQYDSLYFNNIIERDVNKAVDVMIKGMHIDLLAFVNHRFHFEQLLGSIIPDHLPDRITVPLLIFPY